MIAWSLFVHPMHLSGTVVLGLILPLFLSVAVVYKTVRVPHIRQAPRQVLGTFLYMLGGLIALCVALWAIQAIFL